MELCQGGAGVYLDTKYLDTDRVELHHELPLNEIVYDFFDALKSRTKGYASFDYELAGYQPPPSWSSWTSSLNGRWWTPSPSSSTRTKLTAGPAKWRKSSREHIPRQLFGVPIQASIGGKVIARGDGQGHAQGTSLPNAMAATSPGKKKLLEKQKEGKKRMRQLGSVEVPPGGVYGGPQAGLSPGLPSFIPGIGQSPSPVPV